MEASAVDLRVAALQFAPQLRDVAGNISAASALVQAHVSGRELDVLVLPEMCFTGYCFRDAGEVSPYCEEIPPVGSTAARGTQVAWCMATAKQLRCAVVAGIPERADDKLYNSQVLVASDGALLVVHRKHFLFELDYRWAARGDCFTTAVLPLPRRGVAVRVGFAICMDVNPEDFVSPFWDMECATTFARADVSLVLFSCAWLMPDDERGHGDAHPSGEDESATHSTAGAHVRCGRPDDNARTAADDVQLIEFASDARSSIRAAGPAATCNASTSTVQYWALRCGPLLRGERALVAANRSGTELDSGAEGKYVTFAGSSSVMALGKRRVLAQLGSHGAGVAIATVRVSCCTL